MTTTALPLAAERTRCRSGQARAEAIAAYILSAPAMICLLGILILPTLATFVLSFTDWQFGAPTLRWIGLDNYAHLAADRVFWKSLSNTVLYVAVVVPLSVGLGLGAALLIEAGTSARTFYRAAYFLPVTATLIAMATVWEIMLHPSIGLINLIAEALGFPKQNWLKNPDLALFALAGIGVWQALGLNMVLLLAGLKSIPRDLYEAAAVDGADGPWTRFVTVTLPMLGPALSFVLIISAIRSFQVFDTVAVLTEGGPNKATEVLLYTMYQEGFSFFRAGYGAAITVVFLVFVLLLTLLKARIAEKRVHYFVIAPRHLPFSIFRHAVLMAGAVVMLAPFIWLLSLAVKPADEIFTTEIRLLPLRWDAERNFTEAFAKVPLHRYLLNGVVVTAAIFTLQVLVALPAAYALAKLRFGLAKPLFALVLLGLLIPGHVPAIPHYIMLSSAGLLNSYPALIFPSIISVFGIFWIRQFFRTVPDDLIHAARLDGLSEFSIVWRIMLPAAMPALVAFGILSVVFHWNDYFWPLLVVTSPDMAMPALGTVYLRNTEAGTDYGPLMAGTAIITAPLVIAFLFAQRRFIEGMTLTGLKG